MRTLTSHGLPSLMLGSALYCGLYLGRVHYAQVFTYGFLLWNLFLAWIPWLLAVGVEAALRRQRRVLAVGLMGTWFVFLPNAPYVLTDFLHLRVRTPVPLWYDVLLLGTAALTGLLAGALSLRRIADALAGRLPPLTVTAGLWTAIAASGFGIYLGRFERLNSWDVLLDPAQVMACFGGVFQARAAVVTLACAGLLGVAYLGVSDRAGTGGRPRLSNPA